MSAASVRKIDAAFAALADPTRRGVVDLLKTRPHRPSELADACAMSRPAMSRHLRVLRTSGLIRIENDANDLRSHVYRLQREPFDRLRAWLAEVETLWTAELASFKRHAERTRRKRKR